jgi:hypothetical protein
MIQELIDLFCILLITLMICITIFIAFIDSK